MGLIPIPDEKYARIQQLADEIYYSRDACEPEKIYELNRLATPYPYMDFERAMMCKYFERYRSLKRQTMRSKAWSDVRDYAHKIAGLASIARQPSP